MANEDIIKELWSLANIITGFSVAQSVGVSIALGKDLAGLHHQRVPVKVFVSILAFLAAGAYCFGVHTCFQLAQTVDTSHLNIWCQVTLGRQICILFFTAVFVVVLFAPEMFPQTPITRATQKRP